MNLRTKLAVSSMLGAAGTFALWGAYTSISGSSAPVVTTLPIHVSRLWDVLGAALWAPLLTLLWYSRYVQELTHKKVILVTWVIQVPVGAFIAWGDHPIRNVAIQVALLELLFLFQSKAYRAIYVCGVICGAGITIGFLPSFFLLDAYAAAIVAVAALRWLWPRIKTVI